MSSGLRSNSFGALVLDGSRPPPRNKSKNQFCVWSTRGGDESRTALTEGTSGVAVETRGTARMAAPNKKIKSAAGLVVIVRWLPSQIAEDP